MYSVWLSAVGLWSCFSLGLGHKVVRELDLYHLFFSDSTAHMLTLRIIISMAQQLIKHTLSEAGFLCLDPKSAVSVTAHVLLTSC